MMIRLIGVVLIIGSCSAAGIFMNSALKERLALLKGFFEAFALIKAEIVFKRASVPDILNLLTCERLGPANACFERAAFEMAQTQNLAKSVDLALREPSCAALSAKDRALIGSGLKVMGRYGAGEQAELLDRTLDRLRAEISGLAGECAQKGRLYRALGVSCGIALALLAI